MASSVDWTSPAVDGPATAAPGWEDAVSPANVTGLRHRLAGERSIGPVSAGGSGGDGSRFGKFVTGQVVNADHQTRKWFVTLKTVCKL